MNPQRLILEKLSQVHPRMMTENVLWSTMRLELHNYSLTELRTELRALEKKEQIIVVSNEDSTRAKITTDGLARLAE